MYQLSFSPAKRTPLGNASKNPYFFTSYLSTPAESSDSNLPMIFRPVGKAPVLSIVHKLVTCLSPLCNTTFTELFFFFSNALTASAANSTGTESTITTLSQRCTLSFDAGLDSSVPPTQNG